MKKIAWILSARKEKMTDTSGQSAKKKAKAIIWMIVVGLIWLVLYNSILIKVPFYIYMNLIQLPEECTSLETNVIITDIYGWHVEAERLIYSKQGEQAIEHYIYENNRFAQGIGVRNFYESNTLEYEGDGEILIPSEKYPYQEQDAENYISLRYTSAMIGEWGDLYTIMDFLGIVIMLALCRITYRSYLRRHKNNPVNDSQMLLDDDGQ